jgi:hypothetical protein
VLIFVKNWNGRFFLHWPVQPAFKAQKQRPLIGLKILAPNCFGFDFRELKVQGEGCQYLFLCVKD